MSFLNRIFLNISSATWLILPSTLRGYVQYYRWSRLSQKWKNNNKNSNTQLEHFKLHRSLIQNNLKEINEFLFIDYGCGDGNFLEYIERNFECQCVGFDIDKEGIKSLMLETNCVYYTSDFSELLEKIKMFEGKNIIFNLNSTLAYLEYETFKCLIAKIKENCLINLYLFISDTCKGEMPDFQSNRGKLAYNYNLKKIGQVLHLSDMVYNLNKEKKYRLTWYYQQLWGKLK